MLINKIITATVAVLTLISAASAAPVVKTSPADAAIKAASRQGHYIIVTFYKHNDQASEKMVKEAKELLVNCLKPTNFFGVDVDSSVEKQFVSKYIVNGYPVPLTIFIAPNGAITAGYAEAIGKIDISEAFVSVGKAAYLKAIQDDNIAVILMQSSNIKNDKETLALVEGLKKEAFQKKLKIIKINLSDKSEAKVIQSFGVDANSEKTQFAVMIPPGILVGTYDATATLDAITSDVKQALNNVACHR